MMCGSIKKRIKNFIVLTPMKLKYLPLLVLIWGFFLQIMNTIIYKSHFELLQTLTNEQAGILIKSIGEYSNGNEPIITDVLVKGIFMAIKRDFDLQKENYESVVQRNKENGKKGGRPKKTQKTQVVLQKPTITHNNPKNLKDKDKDKDKDKAPSTNSIDTKQFEDAIFNKKNNRNYRADDLLLHFDSVFKDFV